MRKFKLFFACLLMAVLSIGQMWGGSVTFIAGTDNTSTAKEGITIAMSNTAGASGYYQAYKSSNMVVSSTSANITGVSFVCTASDAAKWGPGSFGAMTGYSYSGTTGTWSGTATSSVTFSASNNQVRMTQITVTYADGGDDPGEDPEPTDDADVVIDLLDAGWNFPTSKVVAENAYTNGDITIKLAGSTGNGYRVYSGSNIILGKEGAYLELPAFESPIEKIVVAGNSDGSKYVTWNIFKGNTAVSTAVTGCKEDAYTFNIDPLEANVVYRVKVTNANNLQIKNIKIYFGEAPAVAKPTFSLASGNYAGTQSVELACATSGATIYYTTDGSDPDNTKTQYTGAISVSENQTIKAIAYVSTTASSVATATYAIFTPLTSMQAIFDRATEIGGTAADVAITFNNWVVSGKTTTGAYVTDGTKGFVIFGSGHGFLVNDKINGTVLCKLQLYKGAAEVTNLTANNSNLTITNDGVVTPVAVNIADLNGAYTGAPIIVNDVTFNGTALVDASSNAITPFTTFYSGAVSDLELNHKYNVTGIFIQYNETKELSPRNEDDIEEVSEKYTVTYDAAPANGTLTIKNGDDVVASGSKVNENTVLTIVATPDEGYKVAEITVNSSEYTASTLTLTEDVTIAASFEQNLAPEITSFVLSEIGVETDVKEEGQRVGDKVNLPLTAATCSKVFVGWDADENCATQPTYAPGEEYTLAADNKLYAVYAVATPGADVDYPIDFENEVETYADWTFVNMTTQGTNSNVLAHGDSYFGTTGGKATATLTTKEKIANPSSITFYYSKQTTNTADSYWKVLVSSNGSDWTELSSKNAGEVTRGTWYEYTEDLSAYSDVYVRVAYSLSTAVRCIDDLVLTVAGEPVYSEYSTECQPIVHNVRFWNSYGWENVYAYVFTWDEINGTVEYNGAWPGQLTSVAGGWNNYDVIEGKTVIFHNNAGAQTVDITNVTAEACYVLTGEADGNGHLYVEADNDCKDRFYIVGNEALTGQDWQAIRLENGSVTFENVAASKNLQFQITNGSSTWAWKRGKDNFDGDCSNISIWAEQADGNVGFETDKAKDITISYDEENDKICVTADDYVAPEYVAFVVAFGDEYYAMTTSDGNNGFAPLAVNVDADGNVIVNSEAEKNSILWLKTVDGATATFQNADNKFLAGVDNSATLKVQDASQAWTWDVDNEYYYMMSGETKRSFFYSTASDGIFKNYAVNNLGKTSQGYSAKAVLYAEAKVVVSTTAKLKFFAPVAWENVIAHTWEGGAVNYTMTPVEEGSRWFECDITKGLEFLIYNGDWNGANQTANIDAINTDKCFAWTAATNENGNIIATEIASCEMNYYVTGEPALTGKDWVADGSALNVNGSITYNEIPEGTYKFRITNGTWGWTIGKSFLNASACTEGIIEDYTDEDDNIIFTTTAKSNIIITYNLATEKISIVATAVTPKEYYTKVTSLENLTAGYYLIVSEDNLLEEHVALNGGLSTLDATNNVIDVEIVTGKGIEVTEATNAAAFFIDPEIGTIKSASEQFIGLTGTANALKQNENIYAYENAFSFDASGNAVIICGSKKLCYNPTSGQNRFRYFTNDQQAIQLYKKAEVAKASPELAFAESAVETIKGNDFTAPALSNEHNVTVTYKSSAGSRAEVDEASGVVTIKAAGEVTIYAVTAGDETYRESYAKYTITINDFGSYTRPVTPDNFGTICLPKAGVMTGATLFEIADYANGMIYVDEVEGGAMEAGKPYIFQATSDQLNVAYTSNVEVAAGENNGLHGFYNLENENAQFNIPADAGNYILYQNQYWLVSGRAAYIANYRAYIRVSEINYVAPAPGRRRVAMNVNGEQTTTGINELNAAEAPVKMIMNGQLYILRGEKLYNANGQIVK